MKRRRTVSRKPAKTRHRKTTKPKRSTVSVAARRASSSVAELQKQLERQARELDEAREQQTATSEVLRIISSSPRALESVFLAMLENAVRICEASYGVLFRFEEGEWRAAAMHGVPPAFAEYWHRGPQRPGPRTALGRVAETKQTIHITDVTTEPAYVDGEPIFVAAVNLGRFRTILNVPILRDNELIGAFAIYRQEVSPFTDKQIALVQNFANQAVIAIENTRLLSELRQRTDDLTESLEQQTATSEVLSVISSSPGDLQPVFAAMLKNAARICEAKFGILMLREEAEGFRSVAIEGAPPAYTEAMAQDPYIPPRPGSGLVMLARTKKPVQLGDLQNEPAYAANRLTELAHARTLLIVPLLKDEELIGAINIYRQEVRPFTNKQIALLENFAAQAVIAVENTRLLNELRQRTADLSKSLEQQTATAEVLKVISSSTGELQPVFAPCSKMQRGCARRNLAISIFAKATAVSVRLQCTTYRRRLPKHAGAIRWFMPHREMRCTGSSIRSRSFTSPILPRSRPISSAIHCSSRPWSLAAFAL